MKDFKVLAVGDMHVGSFYGLAPPTFHVEDEVRQEALWFEANRSQRRLYEYWKTMCEALEKENLDAVIVNGDICEGQQYKQRGAGVWTTDIYQQADVAVGLLEMIPAETFYITMGSGYHSRGAQGTPPIEKYIADRLRERGKKAYFASELLLDIGEKRFHIAHKVGVTGPTGYRTTAIAKELLTLMMHDDETQYGDVDVALRSHAHYFVSIRMEGKTGAVIPGWKARDDFAMKIGGTWCPHIGYVMLRWDVGNQVEVEETLFPSPAPACTVLRHGEVVEID